MEQEKLHNYIKKYYNFDKQNLIFSKCQAGSWHYRSSACFDQESYKLDKANTRTNTWTNIVCKSFRVIVAQ